MSSFVKIVGEIKAAREALIEVTLRLRSYLFQKDGQPSALLAPSPVRSASNMETASNNNTAPRETYTGNDKTIAPNQTAAAPVPAKVTRLNPVCVFVRFWFSLFV